MEPQSILPNKMIIEASGLSDTGTTRELNEDSYLVTQNEHGDVLLLVCDGIGGAASGEIASSMACEIANEFFKKAPEFQRDYQANDWIRKTLNKINDSIYSKSMWNRKNRGMGTTAAGVLVCSLGTYIFNAGDSRVYALYSDGLIQMSEDHSYVQSLVNENKITEKEARVHEKRSALTNALGVWRTFRLDVNKIKSNYQALLICSDGLHGYVHEGVILRVLESSISLDQKTGLLIELAQRAGGLDNCTVIVTGPGKDYGRK